MPDQPYHLPMDEIMVIEVKIADKKELEALAKRISFDEKKNLTENLHIIKRMIMDYLGLTGKTARCFEDYFVEKNIPIEVTFKPLKPEQLIQILEQWLALFTQSSTILEKLYSNNHRNILFKRILFDQAETITQYFNTLSNKKMLRAINLYPLMVEILSNNYLYEYNSDSETFFQKVNSFNIFFDIVNKFVHSEKRISLCNTKEDFQFVRRIQFQRLIQFWEEENPQLILLSEKRINMEDKDVQTTQINMYDSEVQTLNEAVNLVQFINSSLFILNKITMLTNDSKQLASIERLYSFFRKQKIYVLEGIQVGANNNKFQTSPKKSKRQAEATPRNYQRVLDESLSNDPNVTIQKIVHERTTSPIFRLKSMQFSALEIARTITPQNTLLKDNLQQIYNIYRPIHDFSVENLRKCLIDIGVITSTNTMLIMQLQQDGLIPNRSMITNEQFRNIFKRIMQNDKDLTVEVLSQFIKFHGVASSHNPTPRMKPQYSLTPNKNTSTFTSYFHNNSRIYIGKYLNSATK